MRFVPLSEIEQQEAPPLRFVPLNEVETAPLKQTPFVPVSRNLMAQGENLRNKQPVAPVVAPVVAQPPVEPTEEELAIASQPYRGAILKRRPVTVVPPVEAPVEAPPTESELAVAQKPATVNPILARQGNVMRGEQVQAPIVSPIPEGQSVA